MHPSQSCDFCALAVLVRCFPSFLLLFVAISMPFVAVHGFYARFSAFIPVDSSRSVSTIDSAFARSHNLPQAFEREPGSTAVRAYCMGPISVCSVTGFYQTRHPLAVTPFQHTWDVILGQDWCCAMGADVANGHVLDPAIGSASITGIWCANNSCTWHFVFGVAQYLSLSLVPSLPPTSPFFLNPFSAFFATLSPFAGLILGLRYFFFLSW